MTPCPSSEVTPAARRAPATIPASIRRRRVATAARASTTGATTVPTCASPMVAVRAGVGEAPDRAGEVGLHAAERVGGRDGQQDAESCDGEADGATGQVEGRPPLDGAGPLVEGHGGAARRGRLGRVDATRKDGLGGPVGSGVSARRTRDVRRVRHRGQYLTRVGGARALRHLGSARRRSPGEVAHRVCSAATPASSWASERYGAGPMRSTSPRLSVRTPRAAQHLAAGRPARGDRRARNPPNASGGVSRSRVTTSSGRSRASNASASTARWCR